MFDIGSTLWSSPAEDPGALEACYGRGRDILVEALGDVRVVPDDRVRAGVDGGVSEGAELLGGQGMVLPAPVEGHEHPGADPKHPGREAGQR